MGIIGLSVAPSQVSIDPATAAISAHRLSQFKCDILLLAHQDSPILKGAQGAIERAARVAIRNLKL